MQPARGNPRLTPHPIHTAHLKCELPRTMASSSTRIARPASGSSATIRGQHDQLMVVDTCERARHSFPRQGVPRHALDPGIVALAGRLDAFDHVGGEAEADMDLGPLQPGPPALRPQLPGEFGEHLGKGRARAPYPCSCRAIPPHRHRRSPARTGAARKPLGVTAPSAADPPSPICRPTIRASARRTRDSR